MNVERLEFRNALRPVKRRIRRNRMLRGAAFGAAAGFAGALALLILSRVVMIPDAKGWAFAGAAAAAVLAAAGNAARKVTDREAAVQADRCGLQERAVTALDAPPEEAADEMSRAMREAQTRNACDALAGLDPKKIRAGSVRRCLVIAGTGIVLCAALLLIPNRMDRRAEEIRALQADLNRLTAELDEAEKQDAAGKTPEEQRELRKLTEDLKRDLAQSRDEADALVAIDRAEKRLEQMQSGTAADAREAMEAARALSEALSGAGLDSLAQAVEAGDEQALAQALAGMDAEDMEALSQAADGLAGAAKEAAEAMASAAKDGNVQQAASDAMEALQSAQSGGSAGASAMQQALQHMKAALNGGSGSSPGQNGGQAGRSGSQGGGGQGGGGQGGSGAGLGSGSGEQQGSGGESGRGTSGRPQAEGRYREGTYETVYDPEKAEAGFRDVMTEQNRLGEDSVRIQMGEGRGTADGNVPYGQVVGEYARSETRAADSENLTGEQREWVHEYFRLLTEEQGQ